MFLMNFCEILQVTLMKGLEAPIREKLASHIGVRVVTSYACKLEVYLPEFGKYPLRGEDFHNVTCDITIIAPIAGDDNHLIMLHMNYLQFELRVRREDLLPTIKDGILYEGYKYNCPAKTEDFLKSTYRYLGTNARFNSDTGKYIKHE